MRCQALVQEVGDDCQGSSPLTGENATVERSRQGNSETPMPDATITMNNEPMKTCSSGREEIIPQVRFDKMVQYGMRSLGLADRRGTRLHRTLLDHFSIAGNPTLKVG